MVLLVNIYKYLKECVARKKCDVDVSCYDSDSDLDTFSLFLVTSLSSFWELTHTSW